MAALVRAGVRIASIAGSAGPIGAALGEADHAAGSAQTADDSFERGLARLSRIWRVPRNGTDVAFASGGTRLVL